MCLKDTKWQLNFKLFQRIKETFEFLRKHKTIYVMWYIPTNSKETFPNEITTLSSCNKKM